MYLFININNVEMTASIYISVLNIQLEAIVCEIGMLYKNK